MKASYGVLWQEGERSAVAGKLELDSAQLRLEGSDADHVAVCAIPYRELSGVRIGHDEEERLSGRPTLILDRFGSDTVRVASLAQAGVVAEIAEHVAALQVSEEQLQRPLLVVLRIRPSSREQVLKLLADGPPFDPELVSLEQHHVFLSDDAVYFLFEGASESQLMERMLRRPSMWRAYFAWREHIVGHPIVADTIFAWKAPQDLIFAD
ncbi:MAG: hypothetical protein ACXVY8_01000 [Gaiellaceae bacterium]